LKGSDIVVEGYCKFGLCISVHDIRSIEGGFNFPNDGAAAYMAYFDEA
jgi:DNA-directed RNA polymerase subunit E'/Rpb7